MSRIIFNNNIDLLNKMAFSLFANTVNNLLKNKRNPVLGIVGGRSVSGLYGQFKNEYLSVPWNKIHIFMADERIVPLNNEYSNFRAAKESFIDHLLKKNCINENHVHPFITIPGTEDYGASRYIEEFKSFGGDFDILILGAGEDGHIAALFPEHQSFYNESKYYTIMDDSPKPPPARITITKILLQKSKSVFLYFLGEHKKNAYKNFLDKNVKMSDCPAKLIDNVKNSYVITDINSLS